MIHPAKKQLQELLQACKDSEVVENKEAFPDFLSRAQRDLKKSDAQFNFILFSGVENYVYRSTSGEELKQWKDGQNIPYYASARRMFVKAVKDYTQRLLDDFDDMIRNLNDLNIAFEQDWDLWYYEGYCFEKGGKTFVVTQNGIWGTEARIYDTETEENLFQEVGLDDHIKAAEALLSY